MNTELVQILKKNIMEIRKILNKGSVVQAFKAHR